MRVSEKQYKAMPAELQALFRKCPNPGSDEVVGLFPVTTSRGHTPSSRGAGGISCDGHRGQDRVDELWFDSGSASRFFYCAKASKSERDMGCDGLEERLAMRYSERAQVPLPQQTPGKPVAQRNHHPTVKPLALMRYLCRLVTPPNGIVLDMFAGSGSTLVAAKQEGFRYVGCELNEEYVAIATVRIAAARKAPPRDVQLEIDIDKNHRVAAGE